MKFKHAIPFTDPMDIGMGWRQTPKFWVTKKHTNTPWKINMEHNNGALVQMIFLLKKHR